MFSPKYRGKILIGDMAIVAEAIICKTCREMDIKIIEKDKRKIKQNPERRVSASQGLYGMSLRNIFQLITHTSITGNNPVYS